MNRKIFGGWGDELNDQEFAKTLLAAGMAQYQPLSSPTNARFPWIECRYPSGQSWTGIPQARGFADAWEQLKFQLKRREFRIQVDAVEPDLIEALAEAARSVGAASMLVSSGVPVRGRFLWRPPLRIGLLADAQSRDLAGKLQKPGALPVTLCRSIQLVDVAKGLGPVDLVVHPGSPSELAEAVGDAVAPFQAGVLACLGGFDARAIESLRGLIELGVGRACLADTAPDASGWLAEVLLGLSRKLPLDIAAWGVWRRRRRGAQESLPPLILGSFEFFDETARATTGRKKPTPRSKAKLKPPVNIGTIEDLTSGGDGEKSLLESIFGPDPGNDERPVRSPRLESKVREARHLQANVYRVETERVRAFHPGAAHRVDVFIGPQEESTVRFGPVFRDDQLPWARDGETLTVVLFDRQIMEQPQLRVMHLPKTGVSEICTFQLKIPLDVRAVNAWVMVLHANRVMQTALLRGPVTTQDDGTTRIELVMNGAVDVATANLSARRQFDGALVLNSGGKAAGITSISGTKTAYIRLDQSAVNAAIAQINQLLNRSDWDQPGYTGLFETGTSKLLNDLAVAGSSLYDTIVRKFARPFATEARVQVVAAIESARLPVEFIYDRKAPKEEAPICPNAAIALAMGKCPESESCPSAEENPCSVVCPLGFWCNSRVIEWHAFSEERASRTTNAAYLLEAGDETRRGVIKAMHNPVVGYSAKVTSVAPDSIARLIQKFGATHVTAKAVDSWPEWKKSISSLNPTLLVLLVHSDQKGVRALIEMGPPAGAAADYDPMMPVVNLDESYIFDERAVSRPVVLLLGCGTGVAKVEFQSVAARFADYGAAIVVSTSADIYGPRAVDLAADFVDAFAGAGKDETFGDIMLRVRRAALGAGNPMVLCLKAYGDADWRLEV
jgi:hypothetical protein